MGSFGAPWEEVGKEGSSDPGHLLAALARGKEAARKTREETARQPGHMMPRAAL